MRRLRRPYVIFVAPEFGLSPRLSSGCQWRNVTATTETAWMDVSGFVDGMAKMSADVDTVGADERTTEVTIC